MSYIEKKMHALMWVVVVTLLSFALLTPFAEAQSVQTANGSATNATTLLDRIQELQDRLEALTVEAEGNISATDRLSTIQEIINRMKSDSQRSSNTYGNASARVYPWCTMTWDRPLSLGDRGQDVYALQQFLNTNVATRVSSIGDGSPGFETDYFGPKTAAAIARLQNLYREEAGYAFNQDSAKGVFGDQLQTIMKRTCSGVSSDDSYTLADVASVTVRHFDPLPGSTSDNYSQYTVTLQDGKTHTVKVFSLWQDSLVKAAFAKTGFTGDSALVISKAEEVNKEEGSASSADDSNVTVSVQGAVANLRFPLRNGCMGYMIDWGDGATRSHNDEVRSSNFCTMLFALPVVVHTYEKPGSYTITLTLLNNGKKESVYTRDVKIQEVTGILKCVSGNLTFNEGTRVSRYEDENGKEFTSGREYFICDAGDWVLKSIIDGTFLENQS